ncbi:hypothetical protein [Kitasatospora camelliae]|uniref:Uncharacterized protein n=1 Tax=Kitasatospora camelliae TaxID=3156397 RepID=A0AAU8K7Z6_9ACTN
MGVAFLEWDGLFRPGFGESLERDRSNPLGRSGVKRPIPLSGFSVRRGEMPPHFIAEAADGMHLRTAGAGPEQPAEYRAFPIPD